MKAAAVLLLLMLIPAPHCQADTPCPDRSAARFRLGVETWFVTGRQVLSGGPVYARNRFEIDHPTDGVHSRIVGEAHLLGPWRLRAAVGRSRWDTGTMADTDWDGRGRLWYFSTSASDGDTTGAELDFFYRPLRNTAGSYLELAVGYHYLKNEATFRDAHLLLENYAPISQETAGVWNENETILSGIRLGFRAAWFLGERFSVKGNIGYIPYLWGRYRATRYAGLPYEQLESVDPRGHGLDLAVALSCQLHSRADLELGYRSVFWRAGGDEKPESSFFGIRNDFAIDRSGVFVRVAVVF